MNDQSQLREGVCSSFLEGAVGIESKKQRTPGEPGRVRGFPGIGGRTLQEYELGRGYKPAVPCAHLPGCTHLPVQVPSTSVKSFCFTVLSRLGPK